MILQRSSRAFVGVSALLFAASAALTVAWCESMSTMHAMPMPGGWTMSMMWMRMPGQSWPGAAAAFLGMWCAMTAAMMLPSLVPMLARYRRAVVVSSPARLDALTIVAGGAYFFVWTLCGALTYVAGTAIASLEMRSPVLAAAVPTAVGAVVLIAGVLQFTAWKARHLACCRSIPPCCGTLPGSFAAAWRHGLRLGWHCVQCCCGLTMVLLVVGMMDLRAMALVTAATGVERFAPNGDRMARVVGVILLLVGSILVARAAGA